MSEENTANKVGEQAESRQTASRENTAGTEHDNAIEP